MSLRVKEASGCPDLQPGGNGGTGATAWLGGERLPSPTIPQDSDRDTGSEELASGGAEENWAGRGFTKEIS